jgi:hypothetical protein
MTEMTKKEEWKTAMTDTNTTTEDTAREILKKIDEAWPSPIVLRKDIAKFSCGLTTHRAMEVADQKGQGIQNRLIINGKVAYTKESALKWIESRIKPTQAEEKKRGAPRSNKNDILLNWK